MRMRNRWSRLAALATMVLLCTAAISAYGEAGIVTVPTLSAMTASTPPVTARGSATLMKTAHRITDYNPDQADGDSDDVGYVDDTCCVEPIRGNFDYDPEDKINVVDLTYHVAYRFGGGPAPPCMIEADWDADGSVSIIDLTWTVQYLFGGGPQPWYGDGRPPDSPGYLEQ